MVICSCVCVCVSHFLRPCQVSVTVNLFLWGSPGRGQGQGILWVFCAGSYGKERICQQSERPGFDPWVRKIPWRRALQPTPLFLTGSRNLACYSPWDCRVGQDWAMNASWLAGSCRDEWVSELHLSAGWWLKGKASACNAGDPGLIPGSGRSPGEGNGNPLQYSYLENSMGYNPWSCKESDTTERLNFFSSCVARLPGCLSRRAVHRLASWLP